MSPSGGAARADRRDSAPIAPLSGSIPKRFRAGTHRLISPEETVERARRCMAVMGITRVANVTGLDVIGVPVVMVCRPNARSLSVSQGKGLTLPAAKASGLMEAIEMYHAEHITLPLKLCTYHELCFTHRMIELPLLPRVQAGSLHGDQQLLWIEGRSLLSGVPLWLPFELVHMNYTLPLPPRSGALFMSSSGLASGNHLMEAISHGICELVEHDATTLFHLLGEEAARQRRLDLSSVDDPGCREVIEKYERAGVLSLVWETTTDIGIPSFLCTIADRSPSPLSPIPPASGMGCHPAREIALLRALTEAAQSRLTLITGSRDDVRHSDHSAAEERASLHRFQEQARASNAARRFQDAPTFTGETLEDDIVWETERLRAAGITEVVVVDLTKPELGIPVARLVIPGLEAIHDAPGYVPGARALKQLKERQG